jgi:hypothetical protein
LGKINVRITDWFGIILFFPAAITANDPVDFRRSLGRLASTIRVDQAVRITVAVFVG